MKIVEILRKYNITLYLATFHKSMFPSLHISLEFLVVSSWFPPMNNKTSEIVRCWSVFADCQDLITLNTHLRILHWREDKWYTYTSTYNYVDYLYVRTILSLDLYRKIFENLLKCSIPIYYLQIYYLNHKI